jgi:hypothetical protein
LVRGTTDDVGEESLLEHAANNMLAAIKTRSFFIRARFMLATSSQIKEKSYTATKSWAR